MLTKCKWCGSLFERHTSNQSYCSEHCRHEAHLEDKREYINCRNLKEKHYNTKIKNLTELGTYGTSSSCHRKSSFELELKSLRNEYKRIGLKS